MIAGVDRRVQVCECVRSSCCFYGCAQSAIFFFLWCRCGSPRCGHWADSYTRLFCEAGSTLFPPRGFAGEDARQGPQYLALEEVMKGCGKN